MKITRLFVLLMFALVALSACGRRGPLEAPADAPKAVQQKSEKDEPAPTYTQSSGLGIDGLQTSSTASQTLRAQGYESSSSSHPITGKNPKNAPIKPKTPFFLDFLVE